MKTDQTPPATTPNNTRTIARNSLWYGLELFVSLALTFCTSLAVARFFGPDRLGPYAYMVWLTNITISVGSFGIPATARKFMAEYLNLGEAGVARSIYIASLQLQLAITATLVSLALLAVWRFEDPRQMVVSMVLVLAMAPRMIATIPSMANNAAEVLSRNTGPSLIGGLLTAVLTIGSLVFGWGLVGIAAAMLIGSLLECGLKIHSVERWMGGMPRATIAPDLKRRMFQYSGQGLVLMILNIVVWDRSDMVILKLMNHDPKQITFFSLAFNLAERVLMIPNSFLGGLGVTIMAQVARGRERLKDMTVDGARYAMLVSLPLLVGMACLSKPMVLLMYTEKYRLLPPTLTIVALMAIPKALVNGPTMYLQATERQGFLIWCGCLCGLLDVSLDFLLTGRYGASGAAIANGAAQTLAAAGIWIYIRKRDRINLKLGAFGRIVASGAIMAAGVLTIVRVIPGYLGMFSAIAGGAVLWMLALRATRALKTEDAGRFESVGRQLPAWFSRHWVRIIRWLAPLRAV